MASWELAESQKENYPVCRSGLYGRNQSVNNVVLFGVDDKSHEGEETQCSVLAH